MLYLLGCSVFMYLLFLFTAKFSLRKTFLIDWLIDWLILTDWSISQSVVTIDYQSIGQSTDWWIDWFDWWIDQLVWYRSMIDQQVLIVVVLSINRSVMIDRLVDWLYGKSIDQSHCWCIDWIIGWLVIGSPWAVCQNRSAIYDSWFHPKVYLEGAIDPLHSTSPNHKFFIWS